MAIYTVHEPSSKSDRFPADPSRFVFVRDGFYFWAFLLGPLWMLRHRLWLVLIGYLLLTAALQAGLNFIGASLAAMVIASGLLAFLIGLEAATLRRFGLARRRWRIIGVVAGDDLEAAERRFFDAWLLRADRDFASAPFSHALRATAPGVIGLFPEPGTTR